VPCLPVQPPEQGGGVLRREGNKECSDKRPLSRRFSEQRRGGSTSAAENIQQNDDPYANAAMACGAHSAPAVIAAEGVCLRVFRRHRLP
jgi:hypothetical protein